VIVDETQLIERVKLSSSEIEEKHIRLSVDLSEDVFYSTAGVSDDFENGSRGGSANIEDDINQQDPEDIVLTLNPDTDDTALFYETQTDETTLIRFAKLADDSRSEASKCSGKLIHDIICANGPGTQLFVRNIGEEADGLRSPVNSMNDDAESEEVKNQLSMLYNHQEKISKAAEGAKKQVKLYKPEQTTHVTRQTLNKADKNAVVDEDPIDNDFQRLIVEVVKHLQDCDLDEILSMFAGLFSVKIISVYYVLQN
jgi:hypothetical protein